MTVLPHPLSRATWAPRSNSTRWASRPGSIPCRRRKSTPFWCVSRGRVVRVVRLKGGDPYVFGRGGEEGEVLDAEGIAFEVIPGVTSGVAAMAWAGIPVTHRREAVRLTLLTAHEAVKSDGPQVRWDLLAQDKNATIVGYMGVTALPEVVHQLLGGGMDPSTPAAMVEQGTTASQRKVISTLAEAARRHRRGRASTARTLRHRAHHRPLETSGLVQPPAVGR